MGARTLLGAILALAMGFGHAAEHPEARLIAALDDMQAGRLDDALTGLDELVHERPTFRLAQLFYSQLLSAMSGGGGAEVAIDASDPQFSGLIEEARVRLRQWEDGIPEDALPDAILSLSDEHDYAILVDLHGARLYVLRNENGTPRVIRHYYAAMGKAGAGKQVRGDNRTPIGVYHITDWLPGSGLPDLYGHGAYPVNYPNRWDRYRKRTGSGIWVHGVPSNTYSRPPRSSEGCVTVANDDLKALAPFITPGKTPIVFADRVEWLPEAEVAEQRKQLLAEIDSWRSHWSAMNTDAYLAYYANDFSTGNMGRSRFAAHKRRVNNGKQFIDVQLADLALFRYPGEENLYLAQFTQNYASDNYRSTTRKQQFWRKRTDGGWEIVKEESR